MMEIRRARASDAPALAAIAERTFRATFSAGTAAADMDAYCAASYGADIQAREIGDPDLVTWIAESDDELIGFAQWRPVQAIDCVAAERPSELSRIYVDAAWHGRGVAHRLMQEVLTMAADRGADCVWLGVWEQNPKAAAFYRKFGFIVVGEHVFPVGSDMQRDLIMARQ